MATIDLTDVLIHYTVTPDTVFARIRTYAGDTAIKEETIPVDMAQVVSNASRMQRANFNQDDIIALLPTKNTPIWGGVQQGRVLTVDINGG